MRYSIILPIFHFLFKEPAHEFPNSRSLKASVATHDLFGTLNVGREIELGFFFCVDGI